MRAAVPQAHNSHDEALGICKNFLISLGLRLSSHQMGVSGLLSS